MIFTKITTKKKKVKKKKKEKKERIKNKPKKAGTGRLCLGRSA
jgi:hypothetical protein